MESSGGTLGPSLSALIEELLTGQPEVEEVLRRVLELAIRVIGKADGASITLFTGDMEPYTMVATDDWVEAVDQRQYEAQQGPCLEVAATSAPTSGAADLAASTSWPVFGPAAAAVGVRSLLAAGLSPHPDPTEPSSPPGALNLYSRSAFAFTGEDREEALLLAAIAAIGVQLAAARTTTSRLYEALTTRDVIGQAKGILMERHGITQEQAFNVLRRASNDLNIKLRDVAAEIADGGSVNGLPSPRRERVPELPN